MKTCKKMSLLIMVLLLSVTVSLFAGGEKEEIKDEAKKIKIGYTAPFTGSAAEFGLNGWRGVQLALEDINSEGIMIGDELHKIEIVRYDSACEPTEAVSNVRKLILEDKIIGLLGDHCSSCCMGVAPLCEEYKIPGITVECMADAITSPGYDYYFRAYVPSGLVSAWASPVFVEKLDPDTVAFLAINDDYGRSTSEGFSTELEKLGVETAISVFYERGSTDYMPYLSKIKKANPDILIFTGVTPEGATVIKQGKEIGLFQQTKFIGSVEMSEEEIISLVGEDTMEGIYAWAVWESVPPELERRVQEKFDVPMHYGIPYGYDCLNAFAKAIENSQSLDPEDIRDALTKLDFQGYAGRINFESFEGPDGNVYKNQSRIAPYLIQWNNGERTIVD